MEITFAGQLGNRIFLKDAWLSLNLWSEIEYTFTLMNQEDGPRNVMMNRCKLCWQNVYDTKTITWNLHRESFHKCLVTLVDDAHVQICFILNWSPSANMFVTEGKENDKILCH